jgi:hypothetical protein
MFQGGRNGLGGIMVGSGSCIEHRCGERRKTINPNSAGGTHPPDPVINIAQSVKTGDKPGGDHAPGRWRALVATKPYLSPGLSLDSNLLRFSSLVHRKDGRAKLDRGPGAEPAKR